MVFFFDKIQLSQTTGQIAFEKLYCACFWLAPYFSLELPQLVPMPQFLNELKLLSRHDALGPPGSEI